MKIALIFVVGVIALIIFLKYYARTDKQRIKTVFRIYKKIKQENSSLQRNELIAKVVNEYSKEYDRSELSDHMSKVNVSGVNLFDGISKNWSIKNLTLNILMWDDLLILKREVDEIWREKISKDLDEIYLDRGMDKYE